MSEYSTSQRADFIICPEEFLEFISATVTNAAEHLDCCFVPMCPDTSPYDSVTNDFSGLMAEITKRLLKKGIKCRFITEVTAESLTYWKPFIVNSQVRHIDSLKANFVLCDCQHYWGFAINIQDLLTYNNPGMEIKEHQLLLYSNNKSFIEMQQFLFNNLWNNAIPAKQKIMQIERDQVSSIISPSTKSEQIFTSCMKYLRSAIYEILIILPNTQAANFIVNKGILDLLKNAVQNGVDIKILTHIEADKNTNDFEFLRSALEEKFLDKSMNYLYRELDSQDMTIIMDQAVSFSLGVGVELSGVHTVPFLVGASCSNDDSALSFNVSMFESLWIQSEFEKQNKIKQVYFHVFKGLDLKEEKYKRNWSSGQNSENHDTDTCKSNSR